MHLGDALAPLVRRKLRGLSIDRQHAVSTALTQRTNDATVEALGENSEDPSRADLDEVLPGDRRGARRRARAPDDRVVHDLRRARAAK